MPAGLALGSVHPEAVMLTFMITLPMTLGATCLVIGATWVVERWAAAQRSAG